MLVQPSFPGNIPVSKEMRETLVGKKLLKCLIFWCLKLRHMLAQFFLIKQSI